MNDIFIKCYIMLTISHMVEGCKHIILKEIIEVLKGMGPFPVQLITQVKVLIA